jgi:ABC-type transport system involved in multi-copper enzyme maturation permease subunit
VIREAIEMQKDFRGFIWYQSFRQNLTQMGVFFAILLGCGGLLSESSKGSALFTLSLPVTRKQLLGARTGAGLAQLFAIAMVPPLAISLLAPSIGSTSRSSMRSRTASASSLSARCSSAWRRFCRRCSATSGGRC